MPNFYDIDTYVPPAISDQLHVRLLAMDDVDLNHRWRANDVRSPFWRLYLNDRRGAVVVAAGERYLLRERQVLLIPAWVQFDCSNDATLRHFYVHFDLIGLAPASVREFWNRPIQLAKDPHLSAQVNQIGSLLRADHGRRTRVISQAKAVVYQSLAHAILKTRVDESQWALLQKAGTSIEPVIRHIESQIPRPIDNATLAGVCGRSRAHFIKMFREELGMTPKQYVTERRIAWAAERLAFTADSVESISAACGFMNRFHFTRAFTRIIGTPPGKYRKARL